jgi:Asp-tRNA(Asn)/Glu-tRNA(Gln) amidotransferase A subunit family amidase
VIAGYDPADELTAYSVGRIPREGYASFAGHTDLTGVRIGVLREYMDKSLFTQADHETIDIIEQAVEDLRRLGATIVDPGAGGALFQSVIDQFSPHNFNTLFVKQFPALFPAEADAIPKLVEMYFAPPPLEGKPTIRDFAIETPATGESKYYFNRYLRQRGDPNIKDLTDLIRTSRFYRDEWGRDTRFRDVKAVLEQTDAARTLDLQARSFHRLGVQQVVMQCMAMLGLDAVVYPTGNIPPTLIKGLVEPDRNGRSHQAWTLLGTAGFPAMTVPAGFTSHVFDRVRDPDAPDGTRLVGPTPAKLPVGLDILAMPFGEAILFKIASAYEAATRHRAPPPDFGPL